MKKILSVIMALAIVASCLTMVLFAANESHTAIANKSIFVDFENESDLTTYFEAQTGNVTYAANKGVEQSGALKFEGTENWSSPKLKSAATKQVISEADAYLVSFDVCFETLPANGSTSFAFIFRYTGGNT